MVGGIFISLSLSVFLVRVWVFLVKTWTDSDKTWLQPVKLEKAEQKWTELITL